MSEKTSRNSDKFMLRLPDGMRERLKTVAELNGRSMNSEIIDVLKSHLDADDFIRNSTPLPGGNINNEYHHSKADIAFELSQTPATRSDIDEIISILKDLVGDKHNGSS